MNDWYFTASALAVYWVLSKRPSPFPSPPRGRGLPAGEAGEGEGASIRLSAEAFLVACVLLSFYLILRQAVSVRFIVKEAAIFLLWAVFFMTRRVSEVFSVLLFIFLCLIPHLEDAAWTEFVHTAGLLGGGLLIFLFGMAGLRNRLLFSPVPEIFKPLPIVFLQAALLALAFTGIKNFLLRT